MFNKKPQILDVTLRDGSYLIDFQFSENDTAIICKALESSGIEWIEIGHGMGLNASVKGYGVAACSDEAYMIAATTNLTHAKWGMFFIPEIGDAENIKLAASYKMPFIRIGTNITEVEKAKPFIELAKKMGLMVAYNGMKSYTLSPNIFAKQILKAEEYGADIAFLVDSAGGFFPNDIEAYFKACKEVSNIPLGFHGHDNLSLAMANSLKAIECGAVLVDSSLQGMGRSAGNAITEILVAILKQKGINSNVDLNGLIDLGQNIIYPLISNKRIDPLAIISGYARFHSSFTSKVSEYAKKYNLDIRDLIVRLCEEDQINAPDELLKKLSYELAQNPKTTIRSFNIQFKTPERVIDIFENLTVLLQELKIKASKYSKVSILNVVFGDHNQEPLIISKNIHSSDRYIIGSVSISSNHEDIFLKLLTHLDEYINIHFLDADLLPKFKNIPVVSAKKMLRKTLTLTYSDSQTWVEAVEEQILRVFNETIVHKKIIVLGSDAKCYQLAFNLAKRGSEVFLINNKGSSSTENTIQNYFDFLYPEIDKNNLKYLNEEEAIKEARNGNVSPSLLVAWPGFDKYINVLVDHINSEIFIMDAAIGALTEENIEKILKKNISVFRVNIWPVLSGKISSIHESYLVKKYETGRKLLSGIAIVSGGSIGLKGDIIVDNINKPTRVIGVADGKGKVVFDFDMEMEEKVKIILNTINNNLINPALSH